MNQGDSNIPTSEQSRWTSNKNRYTPRPYFLRPVSVHVNQADSNRTDTEQIRWTGINQRPYFPKSAPVHSYGPQVPQSQCDSVFSGLGSSPQHPAPSNPVFA